MFAGRAFTARLRAAPRKGAPYLHSARNRLILYASQRGAEPATCVVATLRRFPTLITNGEDGTDPEREVVLADSVALALLVVLGILTPADPLAFVLADLLPLAFDELA